MAATVRDIGHAGRSVGSCASEDGGGHAPAFEVARHVGSRLGGLAVAIGDRDELFGPIRADTYHDHEAAGPLAPTAAGGGQTSRSYRASSGTRDHRSRARRLHHRSASRHSSLKLVTKSRDLGTKKI